MVLQSAGPRSSVPGHSGFHPRHPRPDATRIAGISGTLVLNILLLMLLLVPMSRPELALQLSDPEPLPPDWITKKPKPPEPPPVEVEVVKPRPMQPPQAQVQPDIMVPPIDEVIVDNGTIAADPTVDNSMVVATAMPTIEPSGPVAGVRLEYGDAPAPTYPRKQLLSGVEGTVLLQVLVDVDGRPLEVTIHRSSGNRDLDDAARRQVLRKWTFRPAMKDGRAVQAVGIVPIDFSLD